MVELLNSRRRRRSSLWAVALILAAVLLAGVVTHRAILQSVGGYLVVQDALEPVDAIVVLTGSYPDRIVEAVRLYRLGYGRLILVTKGVELAGFREAAKMGASLADYHDLAVTAALRLGVPRSALVVMDGRQNSTRAEAEVTSRYLREHRLRSIIVVTSKSHTRRAMRLFQRVSRNGVKVLVWPTVADPFDPAGWWKDRTQVGQVLFEYQKLAFTLVEPVLSTVWK